MDKRLKISLADEQRDGLEVLKQRTGASFAESVRRAIAEYLEKHLPK